MRTRRAAPPAQINCPIDRFPRQEAKIARLTEAINAARSAQAKAPAAEALLEAVNVLLACEAYDEARPDCRLCRNFSHLRAKTANLILKAGRLRR